MTDPKQPTIAVPITGLAAALAKKAAENTATGPAPEPAPDLTPKIVSGAALQVGDQIVVGASIFKVVSVPKETKQKGKDPVHSPGSCQLHSGSSIQKRFALWTYNNYTRLGQPVTYAVSAGMTTGMTSTGTTITPTDGNVTGQPE